jgi:ketosteroid isomerase-like protein
MATDLAQLEARLRKMEDIEEIRTLRMRYHERMNDGGFRDAAVLYAEDAYVNFEGLADARGRAAIADLFERLEKNVAFVKQFISSHIVEVNGDVGSGVSFLDARYAQEGKSIIAALKYVDKYRRTPEGWKFTEMLVKPYFSVPLEQGWGGGKLNNMKFVEPSKA